MTIYNLSNPIDAKEATRYFTKLQAFNDRIEIKKLSGKRSLNQNNYFYLLTAAFAVETGYNPEEVKTLIKRSVCPDMFVYEKKGQKFLKSTADLNKEDMSIVVDRFIKYASENGVMLPLATDTEWLDRIDNEINRQKRHM